jgi:hypothetical protein
MAVVKAENVLSDRPVTTAVWRALGTMHDNRAIADLLFLEMWEICPLPGSASALRMRQIRRANPDLEMAIRQELVERILWRNSEARRC